MGRNSLERGKTESTVTVVSYVSDLAALLMRELPEVDANEIVAEVEAHLVDHVDELVAAGATVEDAEVAALAGFGRGDVFASTLAVSATEAHKSTMARRVGKCTAIAAFCGAFALSGSFAALVGNGQRLDGRHPFPRMLTVSEPVLNIILVSSIVIASGIPLFAFLGRKSQTRNIALLALATLFLTLFPIVYVGPGHPAAWVTQRDQVQADISYCRGTIEHIQRKIELAKSPSDYGRLSYRTATVEPVVSESASNSEESWFKRVDSVAEAREAWNTVGPKLLARVEERRAADVVLLNHLPKWTDWRALRQLDWWTWVFPFAAALIAVDRIAAWAGRRSFLESQRRRRTAHTA